MISLAVNLIPRHKTDYETPTGPKLVITLIYLAGLAAVLIIRRSPITYMLYFGLPAYFLLGTMNTLGVVKMESITAIGIAKACVGALGAFIVAETICNGFHDRVVFTYAFAVSSVLLVILATSLLARRDFLNATKAIVMAVSTAILAPFTTFSVELEANTLMIIYGLLEIGRASCRERV